MRRFATLLGTTALVALAAACTNGTPRVDGAAAPTGLAPSASPAVTATTSASATPAPTTPVATTPVSQAPSSAPPTSVDAAHLTISPNHIGKLRIGLSVADAKATGLITVTSTAPPTADGCTDARWKGQSDKAWMVFNGKYGLRSVSSYGQQKTPEGIRPGSSLAAVRAAYPQFTWRIDGDETPDAKRTDGDVLADVVKGDGAHYRINIQKSKVTSVDVESYRTGCYE